MVFRTVIKYAGHLNYPKMNTHLPALTIESMKHHASTIPLHVFTIGGAIFCALYCFKLGAYEDTTFNKGKPFKDIAADKQLPLIVTKDVVSDVKKQKTPSNRPQVKEGQKFED